MVKSKRAVSYKDKIGVIDWIIFVFLLLAVITIIFPFWNALVISLSSEKTFLQNPLLLFPKELNFDAYLYMIETKAFWDGYLITLLLVVFGTVYSLFFTLVAGFALSRKFVGKNFIMNLIIVTMFFGGGLIPYFELIRNLGLINTFWVMVVPGMIGTFNMLLIRNYFQSLPEELAESARIDGANDLVLFARIFLPLAMPMVATIGLFYAVGNWNQWYTALLFITSRNDLKPLQLVLREMIVTKTSTFPAPSFDRPVYSEGTKMAAIFFTITPIMCLYPFLQKYFVKGIMIGAIKG